MIQRKRPRTLSRFDRDCLAIVDDYEAETGDQNPDLRNVAAWGLQTGRIAPRRVDVVRQIARDLARACSHDYVTDESGEPVRRRHAYKERRGDEQLTFWFKMEDGTPEQMRMSVAARRRGTLMDMLQLDRDVRYYNKNYNPGDPIELEANFTPDLEERRLPTEYPDAPPDDDRLR